MKKLISILLTLTTLMFTLTAFAETATPTAAPEATSNILVAVFSRAGENYGVGEVRADSPSASYAGYVEKGNTQIMAEMIAEATGADLFTIAPVTPYPEDYASMLTVAREEAAADARPEMSAQVENMADYDVVFIGYPIWDGEMPQILFTFMESYDFTGKTVIPFNTHAGSGQSGTVSTIRDMLPAATVLDGMALAGTTTQNDQDSARQSVTEWVATLDLPTEE